MNPKLETLIKQGLRCPDPGQVFLDEDVRVDRIDPSATLYPGTRLLGARTYVGPSAKIGSEGPATVVDACVGARAELAAGYFEKCVLFEGAKAGWGAHIRAGSILEEQASTAHCVGLKQTVLLSFVTLGSVINLCDCLMAGGTSRKNHSEVGSGFIHFNFTPWGERGDKATASLLGDVEHGVFLDRQRIFLGGSGGLVGPARVGYGAITGAGQVVRGDVEDEHFVLQTAKARTRKMRAGFLDRLQPRLGQNLEYVVQLLLLWGWYRDVRLVRAEEHSCAWHCVRSGMDALENCIESRWTQLRRFASERGHEMQASLHAARCLPLEEGAWRTLDSAEDSVNHVEWVQGLSAEERKQAGEWMNDRAERLRAAVCESASL